MEGLEWSLSSPIGKLLWFLVAVFGALCSVYALLHWRMRSKDVLAAKYRDHYRNAEALAVGWSFVGAPRADFFGRQSIVENEQGVHAYCTLPSPDILQPDVLQRFEDFQWALHHQRLPGLRGCRWLRRGAAAASVQQGVLDAKGRCLPTLREILMEGSLRAVEAENLLLELSRALAALHDLKAPSGRLAFHGFLLPRSIYVQRGPGGEVRSVQLADTGWVFSLGAENVRSRLALLKRGKLLIDPYLGRTLLEQLPFLAPELQPQSEGELVGPEADFYSFGALAVALFTKERFVGPNTIEWERVPQRWCAFLQRCLKLDPLCRPKDFLELEEWLQDPELQLTQVGDMQWSDDFEEDSLPDLNTLLQRLQQRKWAQGTAQDDDDCPLYQRLRSKLQARKWEEVYAMASEADPTAELRLYRLMAAYELGKRAEVETLSRELEEEDADRARRFRDFMAFHI